MQLLLTDNLFTAANAVGLQSHHLPAICFFALIFLRCDVWCDRIDSNAHRRRTRILLRVERATSLYFDCLFV